VGTLTLYGTATAMGIQVSRRSCCSRRIKDCERRCRPHSRCYEELVGGCAAVDGCARGWCIMFSWLACASCLMAEASRRDARRKIPRNSGDGGDAVRIVLVMSRWVCPHTPRKLGGTVSPRQPSDTSYLLHQTSHSSDPHATGQVPAMSPSVSHHYWQLYNEFITE